MQKVKLLFLQLFIYSIVFSQTNDSTILTFISDTQTPLPIERLFQWHIKENKEATKTLLNHIAQQPSQNIFMLGDVVGMGCKNKYWKPIDSFLVKARQNNKNVYALLGNHDVMLHAQKGIKKFEQRFPYQAKAHVEIKDSIAVVMLNSNFKKLSKAEFTNQQAWYDSVMPSLDKNNAVKTIIVCCHHSPYSNSKVVGSNKNVQENFVKAFTNTSKCKLFISGHSHNFEQFQQGNKSFFVIGGGGGIHQPLKTNTILVDKAPQYKPQFHYLTLQISNNKLHLICYELTKDNTMKKGYSYDIYL